MAPDDTIHLAPQTGCGLRLGRGDTLRVISPTGEQVADVTAFVAADVREWLSSGRTIDYAGCLYVKVGTTLYSNRSTPLLTVTADTAGRHDFLLSPCSAEMFRRLYRIEGHHPSCFENLATSLAPMGIAADAIPTTLNLFMVVTPDPVTGRIDIEPPSSRPGDFVDLRAEVDLVVGVTACSAELTNNGTLKPIDVEIHRTHA
ncbi:MAG: urea carboxylase-associated family protein [Actinobacteria bacterium]|nr:urea carboxylase-associated family protein [Actinomycetota bacterium]MBW3643687.1 urea carboxylase-associated family protein [Actinomycetota bacterium]